MLSPDHIMIETPNPVAAANAVSERFGLPFAWPLVEKEEYSSIGVNFGTINFEFINFRVRFGIPEKSYAGLSGLAFKSNESEELSLKRLGDLGLSCRTGERCEAHTTITVEEDNVFPTFFLVKYHFDTSGWQARLKQEFQEHNGGKFNIDTLKSIVINQRLPESFFQAFESIEGNESIEKPQIVFETNTQGNESVVISDLIENLEIILAPRKGHITPR